MNQATAMLATSANDKIVHNGKSVKDAILNKSSAKEVSLGAAFYTSGVISCIVAKILQAAMEHALKAQCATTLENCEDSAPKSASLRSVHKITDSNIIGGINEDPELQQLFRGCLDATGKTIRDLNNGHFQHCRSLRECPCWEINTENTPETGDIDSCGVDNRTADDSIRNEMDSQDSILTFLQVFVCVCLWLWCSELLH